MITSRVTLLPVVLALGLSGVGGEAETWVTLADFDTPAKSYTHVLGAEFAGAEATFTWHPGGAEDTAGALAVDYDFTGGGRYVAWGLRGFFPSRGSMLRFRARSDDAVRIVFRAVDRTGQYHQRVLALRGGGWQTLETDVAATSTGWRGQWDGANDGRVHWPLTQVWIGPERSDGQATGRLLIDQVQLHCGLIQAELRSQYWAYYARHTDFRARGAVAGNLFYPDDPVELTLTVTPPKWELPLSVSGRIQDIDGTDVASVGAVQLTAPNGYKASVRVEVDDLGYFEVQWAVAGETGTVTEARTCFAIVPENEHETPQPDSPFGVNVHFTQGWSTSIARIIQRTGIKWIRDHLSGNYDAKEGEYRSLDPTLLLARDHGLCFLPISPYWKAKQLEEADGVWTHRAGVRQAEAYARKHRNYLDAYELYNEPNNFGGWTGRFGGSWNGGGWLAPFVDFGRQVTQAIRRGDPGALVLWPEGDVFVLTQQFIEAGARPELDAIAPHTYSLHQPSYPEDQSFIRSIGAVREAIRAAGLGTQIWSTEVGFPSYTAPPGHKGFHRPLTERQQADVLARMMILHLASGITKVFYYDFYEDGPTPTNPEHRFGLVRHRTTEPKPAVVAYANLISWLTRARFLGRYPAGGNGEAFAFRNEQHRDPVIAAWVKQGTALEHWLVRSGAEGVIVTDIHGRGTPAPVRDGKLRITLTESPVFVTGLTRDDIEPLLTPLP